MEDLLRNYKNLLNLFKGASFDFHTFRALELGNILSQNMKAYNNLESFFILNEDNSIHYEYLHPAGERLGKYFVNSFVRGADNKIITPENMFNKVLPNFYPFIPETLREFEKNPDKEIDFYKYSGAVIAMRAIEKNNLLKLDFSWGA